MMFPEFNHENYVLDEHTGVLSRKVGHISPKTAEEGNAESRSVLETLTAYVQVNENQEMNFQ